MSKIITNWSDPKSKVSENFTVHEATFLPSWGIHHIPTEIEKANILRTALVMEKIRFYLKTGINVHCWLRPTDVNCPGSPHHGGNYNKAIGGALHSAHIQGLAVDWSNHANCDFVRVQLLGKLGEFGACMENLPGSTWIHIDLMPPRGGKVRFFKP